jgi:excisionase family DNA binding protein
MALEHSTPAGLPHLVDIPTLAGHLGVGVRHVRRLVAERRIPYVKWGHLIRFDLTDISKWVEESKRPLGASSKG